MSLLAVRSARIQQSPKRIMGVASHLQIRLEEYDARIRTFVPWYEEMLRAAAAALSALDSLTSHIVDLGTGTGALAAECLQVRPNARVTLIDSDPDILHLARQRLHGYGAVVSAVCGSFAEIDVPSCNIMTASLALHHIRSAEEKRDMYRKCHAALAPGGLLVIADCCPSRDAKLAALEHEGWRTHLLSAYTAEEADRYLAAWADEDVYFSLPDELSMIHDAGLAPNVIWRRAPMVVIASRRA